MSDNNKTFNDLIMRGVEIREYRIGEEDEESQVELQLPVSTIYYKRRSVSEYKELALDQVRTEIDTIFNLIDFLTVAAESDYLKTTAFIDFSFYLCKLGKGYTELLELIEMDFGKLNKETAPVEVSPQRKEPSAENIFNHTVQVAANKIHYILTSDAVSSEMKTLIEDVIFDAQNEIGVQVYHRDIIKTALPVIFNSEPDKYQIGVFHAISSIIDRIESQYFAGGELKQFETRFISDQNEQVKRGEAK